MGQIVGDGRKKRRSHRYFLDCGGGPGDCVLLAGIHLSGTTWVAELLNHRNRFRMIFEPFRAEDVPAAAVFARSEWIPEDGGSAEQLSAARAILSGEIRARWADQFNRRRISRWRLVKETRANLMLGWIRRHFPEMPILFLLRHPCAVAASLQKFDWGDTLQPLVDQPALRDSFEDRIALATTKFERDIVRWCIEHSIALEQTAAANIPVFHYEHLCHDERDAAAAALFRAAGMPPSHSLDDAFARPSNLARIDSAITTGQDVLDSWRRDVSTSELDFTLKMLERFGLDHLYGEESLPTRSFGATAG